MGKFRARKTMGKKKRQTMGDRERKRKGSEQREERVRARWDRNRGEGRDRERCFPAEVVHGTPTDASARCALLALPFKHSYELSGSGEALVVAPERVARTFPVPSTQSELIREMNLMRGGLTG